MLKITYNQVSFLLMGDAGFEAENSIMAAGYNLKSTILKVGHHWSSSATGLAFLNTIQPAVQIIEVGAGNDYRTSGPADIGRPANIVVTNDGVSYTVSTEKQSPASIISRKKTSECIQSTNAIASTSGSSQQFVGST